LEPELITRSNLWSWLYSGFSRNSLLLSPKKKRGKMLAQY